VNKRVFAAAAAGLAISASGAAAQLQLRARSYVFLLQDTRDGVYYLRAFDDSGVLYSEVALDSGRLPTYTGFAVLDGRAFATTYDFRTVVEFDPLTGEQIASFSADPGEIVIGLDSDQTSLFVNGFTDWTAVYSPDGQLLDTLPKPDSFTGGGLLSVHGSSLFYYDEQFDTVVEADAAGNVLDTIAVSGFMAIPDGFDYDPSADEFLFSGHGVLWRFNRQGQMVSEITLDGFGPSFHNGFEYFPESIPAPATLLTPLASAGALCLRRRRNGSSG